ncbi:MAG: ABC transporter substrate-binding protein [Candidatus Hatepunaea meridiana]|nr:ABC transporter substrate-binding protein [Candidatus Hatepunaea meridiana]
MKLSNLKYVFALFLISLISCTTTDKIVEERYSKAKRGEGDIVIGVVWPESKLKSDFSNGVKMALSEVNSDGAINGRRIRAIYRDSKGDKSRNREIAHEFSRNTDMIGVFGHFYSSLALPSSVTYQENGLIFLTPGSLQQELSMHGFDKFFRSIPNTNSVGQICASYTYKLGFHKPLVLWERSGYGKNTYQIYKSYLAKVGINIENSFSFFSLDKDYRSIIAEMKNLDFDVIFMAVSSSDAPNVIRIARENGIEEPFLGVNLVEEVLRERTGEYARNIYTVSNFDPESDYPATVEFVKKFKEKYDHTPDVWGAYGYDGIKLFAYLIKTHKTSHPEVLASNLRYLENWAGATGSHTFTNRGEIKSKPLYLNQLINNRFVQISVDTLKEIDLYSAYNRLLRKEIEKGYLKLFKSDDVTIVLLPDVSIFTGTKYKISELGSRIFNVISEELMKHPEYKIVIEGYADITFIYDRTKSKSEVLLDLSLLKSSQVAKKLYEAGCARSRIKVKGQGFSERSKYAAEIAGKKSFDNRIELVMTPIKKKEMQEEEPATLSGRRP